MIPIVDPRPNRLFDPFEGVIPPAGQRIISSGWQGVFRHVLLELMPVGERADHFSRQRGAPTKELDSMAGLVFVTDFLGWTAQEAAEAYIFRSDVPYALNWEPDVAVSARSVDRYQKLVREDELAAQVFHDVTIRLAEKLELNISRQRLDSTHVFSHRASLGRTNCRKRPRRPTARRWSRCSISSKRRHCCRRRCSPTPSTITPLRLTSRFAEMSYGS